MSLGHVQAEKIPEVPGVKFSSEKIDLAHQIRAVFADAPIMMRVAMCESGIVHRENGELKRNKQGSSARGMFQVMMYYHEPEMRRMGLNPNRIDEYLIYVRYLFDKQGLKPWAESKPCWGKYRTTPPRG
jgi:hypothetical protein